jgi:hypothetical protein
MTRWLRALSDAFGVGRLAVIHGSLGHRRRLNERL